MASRAAAARVAARSWARMYQVAASTLILRATIMARVTAGLKCAPETWPIALTMTPMVNPCASAMARRTPPGSRVLWNDSKERIAPAPTKSSAKVPIPSARSLEERGYFTPRPTGGRYLSPRISRDVARRAMVEALDELQVELGRLPRGGGGDEVGEEPREVRGDLRDQVLLAEQAARDGERFLAATHLVDIAGGVEVLVEEDVEHVVRVELRPGLLDPQERHLVHHDDVRGDGVEGPDETLRVVPQVGQGEHEAAAGPAELVAGRQLHDLEHLRKGPGRLEPLRKVHRNTMTPPRLQGSRMAVPVRGPVLCL